MKDALVSIINDAYERGKLDAELGVRSDLSLFAKDAAAQILDNSQGRTTAHYVPDAAIVELPDGRLGVFCERHSRAGYRLVKVSHDHGVEIHNNTILTVWKYPQQLAGQLIEALSGIPNSQSRRTDDDQD